MRTLGIVLVVLFIFSVVPIEAEQCTEYVPQGWSGFKCVHLLVKNEVRTYHPGDILVSENTGYPNRFTAFRLEAVVCKRVSGCSAVFSLIRNQGNTYFSAPSSVTLQLEKNDVVHIATPTPVYLQIESVASNGVDVSIH